MEVNGGIRMGLLETKYGGSLYVVVRVVAGALFFSLGCMKLFGLWGMPGGPAIVGTLVWFAGLFEVMIGLSLVTGVLVRLASAFGVIMMAVAYYVGHVVVGGWNPIVNMGIAAILYALLFVLTFVHGAKGWSLEHVLFGKEYF